LVYSFVSLIRGAGGAVPLSLYVKDWLARAEAMMP
jgi:hypothetical protein